MNKQDVEAIAIGHFDGIHRGHKELIKRLGKNGALVIIEIGMANLTPKDRREEYSKLPCFYYDFEEIRNLDGRNFVNLLKKDFINLKKIVVGYDFRFGKDRGWDKFDLKKIFDGEVEIVNEFTFDGMGIHSSNIRRFIKNGDIYRANRLLGREYSIRGVQIRGNNIGSKKLFATINVDTGVYLLPKNGVYATRTKFNDITYPSVTFIGNRLSVDNKFSVETHILSDNLEEVKTQISICFIEFIRENKKFDDLKDLKTQIQKDIKIANVLNQTCDITTSEKITHTRTLINA